MLVAAVGIVLYVALVIAIPVCRLLDWLTGAGDEGTAVRRARKLGVRRTSMLRLLHLRTWRNRADDKTP
jgi:hypothetical protein